MINKEMRKKAYELLEQVLFTYKISNNLNYTTYEFIGGINVFVDIDGFYTRDICRIDFPNDAIRFVDYNASTQIFYNYYDYEKFIINYEFKFLKG